MSKKVRRKPPLVQKLPNDKVDIMCPFCDVPHKVYPHKETPCGTFLELMAVQNLVTKYRVKCIRCGEAGGTLVKHGDAYVHQKNCNSERLILNQEPKYSQLAKFIAKRGPVVRSLLESVFGATRPIHGLDEQGIEQGIIGYCFEESR